MKNIAMITTFVAVMAGKGFDASEGHAQSTEPPEAVPRHVAITIDDLPSAGEPSDLETLRYITHQTLEVLEKRRVPAIGFVNEGKLFSQGGEEARIEALEMWLDVGMELGNHTYSHLSLHETPLSRFQADVIRGDVVTRRLVESRGGRVEFFRHPYTRTGPTAEIKTAFESFLRDRGYKTAPFTVESVDYMFNAIYVQANLDVEEDLAARVRTGYLEHVLTMFEYFEQLSVEVVGYEVKQILLIHANLLNADCLDDVLSGIEDRGYTFVSLEEALRDEAYQIPDEYVGRMGLSWLHRWTVNKGLPMTIRDEPDPPKFILDAYNALN